MCHKAVKTTLNINNIFDPGTASKRTVQWEFKMFCKEDESLEDEEHSGQPSDIDNNQLRGSSKQPLKTTEVAEEFNNNHSTVIQHLKQIGKVNKLNKWAPYELTTNQKNHFEVSCSFILCNNNEPFLNWIVTCGENWNVYNNW